MSSMSRSFLQKITAEYSDQARHAPGTSPTCRQVVERTLTWLTRLRTLLVRFERLRRSDLVLQKLACALIAFRQAIAILG